MRKNIFLMYKFIPSDDAFHAIVCEKGENTHEKISNTFSDTIG